MRVRLAIDGRNLKGNRKHRSVPASENAAGIRFSAGVRRKDCYIHPGNAKRHEGLISRVCKPENAAIHFQPRPNRVGDSRRSVSRLRPVVAERQRRGFHIERVLVRSQSANQRRRPAGQNCNLPFVEMFFQRLFDPRREQRAGLADSVIPLIRPDDGVFFQIAGQGVGSADFSRLRDVQHVQRRPRSFRRPLSDFNRVPGIRLTDLSRSLIENQRNRPRRVCYILSLRRAGK